jgi:hypothetical protein
LSPWARYLPPGRGFEHRFPRQRCIPRRVRGRTLGFNSPDIFLLVLQFLFGMLLVLLLMLLVLVLLLLLEPLFLIFVLRCERSNVLA